MALRYICIYYMYITRITIVIRSADDGASSCHVMSCRVHMYIAHNIFPITIVIYSADACHMSCIYAVCN